MPSSKANNRSMKYLPWLLVVALAVAIGLFYNTNQQQAAELAQLRPASQELEQLRTSQADTNRPQALAASEELTRLREENKEILHLRNEIRQVRDQHQQLSRQAQTAQAQLQGVQAQAEAARTTAAQNQAQAQQLQNSLRTQAQVNACVNNLRQIDGAIQQWALENRQPATAPVTLNDLLRYLRGTMPACPAGGFYTVINASMLPTCSVPGHALPALPKSQ